MSRRNEVATLLLVGIAAIPGCGGRSRVDSLDSSGVSGDSSLGGGVPSTDTRSVMGGSGTLAAGSTGNGGRSTAGQAGAADGGIATHSPHDAGGAPTEAVGAASGQGAGAAAGASEGSACSSPVGQYAACTGTCGCLPKTQRPEITREVAINECGSATMVVIKGASVYAWGETAELSADGTELKWMDGSIWIRGCDE